MTKLAASRSGPLSGRAAIPGDKSISHRSLMFGALAIGETRISGLLEADDVLATARVIAQLGAGVRRDGADWVVTGRGLGGLIAPAEPLDFGNAGTGARLMMGVVAGHPIEAVFTGDASLCRRPMGRVLQPLKQMGLRVAEERETLPLTLNGTDSVTPIVYSLPVPSAQVKSAVLIAGLSSSGETAVIEQEITRDHTEKMLTYLGAEITIADTADGRVITLKGQPMLEGKPIHVSGDPSSAAFLVAAALICPGSDLVVENVLINPTRTGFYTSVREMGADIAFENEREQGGERVADIHVRHSALKGVRVPSERAPSMIDEYPVLAVLASFAEGETRMEGLGELRVKESDRLASTEAGLSACGVDVAVEDNTLIVNGKGHVPGGALIATDMDHRIAMSFLVMGLGADEAVTIDDTAMIDTSFPSFIPLMTELGARFTTVEKAGE